MKNTEITILDGKQLEINKRIADNLQNLAAIEERKRIGEWLEKMMFIVPIEKAKNQHYVLCECCKMHNFTDSIEALKRGEEL